MRSLIEGKFGQHLRFFKGDIEAVIAEAEAEDKEADDARRPLLEPPAEFEAGEVEVRKNGKLGSMASKLPEAATLRSWNRECQLAFWAQRKSFWNNKKLSLLQQACRKNDLYPGGDVPQLRDRLIANEFDRALLSAEDTQTEEEARRAAEAALESDSDSDDAPVFTLLDQ